MTDRPTRRLLTVPEVISLTGLPRNRVYALIQEGTLPSGKIGSRIYIAEAALDAFLERFLRAEQDRTPWPSSLRAVSSTTTPASDGARTSG